MSAGQRQRNASWNFAQRLKQILALGDLAPGQQIPSLRALTKENGVSAAVARTALMQLKDEGIISCHHGRGTFLVKRPSPWQRSGPRILYVVLGGQPNQPRARHIVSAINNAGRLDGAECHLLASRSNAADTYGAAREVDATAIILGNHPRRQIFEHLSERGLTVILDGEFVDQHPTVGIRHVRHDDGMACRLGIEHLVALGHRRIALLGQDDIAHPTQPWQRTRLHEWHQSLRDCGLDPDRVRLEAVDSSDSRSMVEAARRLFRQRPFPEAIALECDYLARPIYRVASGLGLKIPDDVSLISLGDDSEPSVSLAGLGHAAKVSGCLDLDQRGSIFYSQVRRGLAGDPPTTAVIPARLCLHGSTSSRWTGRAF